MKVDLRKSTNNLINELKDYCLEEAAVLNQLNKMSQFEKGKAFAMLEIGKKLNQIMFKER